jgi:hypothetical protein
MVEVRISRPGRVHILDRFVTCLSLKATILQPALGNCRIEDCQNRAMSPKIQQCIAQI